MSKSKLKILSLKNGFSPVHEFLSDKKIQERDRVNILKKIEYFNQLTLEELRKTKDFVKIKSSGVPALFELKFKLMIPFRAVCGLHKDEIVIIKIFKGSGSGGGLRRAMQQEVLGLFMKWQLEIEQ